MVSLRCPALCLLVSHALLASDNHMGDGGALHLSKALPFCGAMRVLNIAGNHVSDEEAGNVAACGRLGNPAFVLSTAPE